MEHSKTHFPLLRALESIEQLLHAPNPILKGLGVKGAIIDRWIVTCKPLEHIRVVLVNFPLLDLHQLLQVLILSLQLLSLFLQ